MGIIEGIVVFLKLVYGFFTVKVEKDKERKEKKQKLLQEMKDANKNDDLSGFAASFDKLNRV